ncbi:MAG: DUF3788 domain-containing protein [Verrucomicrobia bacterium]|nr:DUF3788 domain-containing protein [Verrucomicrobiota bacterium]
MLTNTFIDKPDPPTEADLAAVLGPTKALWDQLQVDLATEIKVDVQEWKSYSRKAGWALRLRHGKRAIVYLSPSRGGFTAAFALGDKAVQAARESGLPARVLKIIDEARRYAEGTAVRIDVKQPKDVEVVKRLAAIKLEH